MREPINSRMIARTMIGMTCSNAQRAVGDWKMRHEDGEAVMLSTANLITSYEGLLTIDAGSKAVSLNDLIGALPTPEATDYYQANHLLRVLRSLYGPKAA